VAVTRNSWNPEGKAGYLFGFGYSVALYGIFYSRVLRTTRTRTSTRGHAKVQSCSRKVETLA